MAHRFLSTSLRRALERDIRTARDVAEAGAADAIRRLAVADAKAPDYFNETQKDTRRRLRAHARALGDVAHADGTHGVQHLVEAAAYVQWHRRLFARFLAERNLLRHPEHGVPVTLEEAGELAGEEGFNDAWSTAEAYAARMLPAVFQSDDPVLALTLAPEHAQALRRLLLGLASETFRADDALGWTYQFWRATEKDRVNKAGEKIGADELPAVTQLFTEPYMVQFLLHNTLGAWWAAKVLARRPELAASATSESELRAAANIPGYSFDFLRFVKDGDGASGWRPASGNFLGWPTEAANLKVLDPCCGSGHFLTEALTILAALRSTEEGLQPAQAAAAVLADNLFGLEIDGRCVQIAAFAVALTAWTIGGHQQLPLPHIAWVGSPPPLPKPEFVALANGDAELRQGLEQLWEVFAEAPLLGSLIELTGGDLASPQRLGRIESLLDRLVERAREVEPERAEGAIAAHGMAGAAGILGRQYTLTVTNVPFLGRGKQNPKLARHLSKNEAVAKADLATAMINRIIRMASRDGTLAVVSPQYWLFQGSYELFRSKLLEDRTFWQVAGLGSGAFETISGEVVNVSLSIIGNEKPEKEHLLRTLDATAVRGAQNKADALVNQGIKSRRQCDVLAGPNSRISMAENPLGKPLAAWASSSQGIKSGDDAAYRRRFWELADPKGRWEFIQGTVEQTTLFGGASDVILWRPTRSHIARAQGLAAHGRSGCAVTQMGSLPATLYLEGLFDSNVSAIALSDRQYLPALWSYISSETYRRDLKNLEPSLKANNAVMVQVPFDLSYWQGVADHDFPDGLPEPASDDPTQWLFHGHPAKAAVGTALHVALARLAGYRWPAETDAGMRLSTEAREWIARLPALPETDADGLLPLAGAGADRPLADRLRAYLANAFGEEWEEDLERRLVAEADEQLDGRVSRDGSLNAWLLSRAFRQHCRLFRDRPFLLQVHDGHAGGFSAFIQYHRLDYGTLQKLTYTVLGDWIARRRAENDSLRLEAALILQQKLAAILEGESPYDIFVRWKSLEQQPLGWSPDLDDGVRLNIRPFVTAGVLKENPKGIKWGVDRGKDTPAAPWFGVDKGERNNDRHTTLAEKRAARAAKASAART